MRQGRRNRTKGAFAGAAVLVAAGSMALSLATSSVASASTLNGVATLTNPTNRATLSSGGSQTVFTVVLPPQSDCSGDTAADGYHVFSYLLTQGTSVTSDNFSTGSPSEGLGLVDGDGYYGQANTAPTSGQVIDIPTDFEWADLLTSGATAPELDGGSSAVWQAGIACANPSGVVTDFWNTKVTFTANAGDPRGFVWTALPGSVPPAPTSPSLVRAGKNITVSWVDPLGNGGSPITGYDVYESTTDPPSTSGTAKATASGATATSATVKKLSKTAKYYFVVLAVNAIGASAPSPVETTQDKTTTKVSCSPATVTEAATTVCRATVSDTTLPSDTPTGTVTWSSSGSGSFTGGPSCTLSAGTCSVSYVPSATGKQTVKGVLPTSSQWLTSTGSFKITVKA